MLTPNISLNSPNNGDLLGVWDGPVNQNWATLDALFSGVSAATSGGTGHIHNGTPGQGPQLDHTQLTSIGSRTHPILESEIDGLDTRLTFVEDNYCADSLCGAGSGGGGGGAGAGSASPQPPLHYTDNFTTAAKTKIGQNDWLVSSDSTVDRMETTGRSAFMFIDPLLLGTPLVERYSAVVKAQIPHSTAQRCTFAITRFTADQINDDDSFMMVMTLMSTHQLGVASPFVHACGVKFILILTNNGGVFTITRQAVVEETDGVFFPYQQDVITGLTYSQAETYVRGIHEFSMAKDGGFWYYKDRAPVWTMPPNTISQHFGPLQNYLVNVLGEPPFGSIGFGFSWNIKPLTVIDTEMSWFTMDSNDNVEETNPPLSDPGNTPRPYDEDPVDTCCGGAGPLVGAEVDVYGDGTRIETVIAAVSDTGYRISSGEIIPCQPVLLDPDFVPTDNPEGGSGLVDLPVSNAPPKDLITVTPSDPRLTVTDVEVNDSGTSIAVSYDLDEYTNGVSFDLDVVSTYDPANQIIVTGAVTGTNATPVVKTLAWTDTEGNTVAGALEGRLLYLDIYTENADYPVLGPPYPVDPGSDLTFSGSGFSILRKWFVASNHYRVLLDLDDVEGGEVGTPGSGTTFEVRVANRDGAYGAKTVTIVPADPVIHWVTSTDPLWPAPGTYQIDVHGYNFRDATFTTPTSFEMQAPHLVNSVISYTSTEQATLDVTIADLGGGLTGNVELRAEHGAYQTPYRNVQYNPDAVPIGVSSVTTSPVAPAYEGQVTTIEIGGTGLPESTYRTLPFYNSGSPVAFAMNRFWDLQIPTPTDATIKVFVDYGQAGNDILLEMDKPGFPTASDTTPAIVAQPTPSATDAWSGGTYPGATGTLTVSDPGGTNSFAPGIEIFATAGSTIIPLGPTVWVDPDNATTTYTMPATATPGDAVTLTVTNSSGPSYTWTTQNVADAPVEIQRIVWAQQRPVEGRSAVPATVYCSNLDPAATASIASGATLDSYLVVGQTMEIEVSFAQLSGGTPFTIQIDNPTPVPSSDSIGATVETEADPIVGVEISPPTPGVSRTIRLVGNNLYPPDAYSVGMTPSLTLTANLTWDSARQTKGEWQGTVDVTGTPGQALDLSITRPSGRTFSRTNVMVIRPLDLIPSSISASPSDLTSAQLMEVEFSGNDFGSVRSIDLVCEQPDRQPIGASATVPCTIVGSTSSLVRVQCSVPTGNLGLTYKANFYNSVLDLLKSEAGMFTVVKSPNGPEILNKATLWSVVNTTEAVEQTLSVSLNPNTPINDKNTEIVGTNIILVSVTDISPGGSPGTVFDVKFRNGAAGQVAELAFYNKLVTPEEKDVVVWTITT